MKKKSSFPFILLCFLFIQISCSPKVNKELSKDDGKIEIAIIQLNDVYEIAGVQGGREGNLARVAAYAKTIEAKYPQNLMVMAGDFLNPSLINTMKYEGERIKGKQMVEVLNAMEVDLVAFGNHEFDFDMEDLQKRIDESSFDWIATNIMQVKGKDIHAFNKLQGDSRKPIPPTKSYTFRDQDGTRLSLGLFSATIASNPRDYVSYLDADSCAAIAIDKLKENHEVILGLTHLSMEEDIELAQKEQEVALIMGGHEHDHRFQEVGSVKIAKADANARTVYLHILNYDHQTKKLDIRSELIPIHDKMSEEPTVGAVIDKWGSILEKEIKQVVADPYKVVYKAKQVLDGREAAIRNKQGRLGELFTKAMMAAASTYPEVGVLNSGSFRIDDQLSGDILGIDIFRTLPFGGPIYEVDMKGSLLSGVLRYSEKHTGTGAYLQYSGLTRKGDNWLVNGQALDPDKYYHVVLTDFLLKGYDIPFLTEDNKGIKKIYRPNPEDKQDLRNDIRGAIISYLEKLK